MAGKTLINGTAYKIKGGKTLIGGTGYSIKSGKTLVNSTAYSIKFKENTIRGLFRDGVVKYSAGRNEPSSGNASLTVTADGTYYAFQSQALYWSITKLVKSGSTIQKGTIKQISATAANPYVLGTTVYCGSNGSGAVVGYGLSLVLLQFPSFTVAEADALLQSITIETGSGYNNSSTGNLNIAASQVTNKMAVVMFNGYLAINDMNSSGLVSETLFSSYTGNKSLLRYASNYQRLSINGTSDYAVYGGLIGKMS